MKRYLFALPVLFAAGCSSNIAPPVDTNSTSSNAKLSSPVAGVATPFIANQNVSSGGNAAAPSVKMPQVPPGMSMGTNMTLTSTKDLDAQIATLQKGSDKKKLAQVLAERGTLRMNDQPASPRIKYRAALADYRAALKADPTNVEAKTNQKLIESIYNGMGMPVPQG